MNDTFPEEMPLVADARPQRNGRPHTGGPSLARTSKKGAKLPDRIILYAPPGWGKTSFAARMPDPIFLMTPGEDRLLKLIANGLLPPTGYFEDLAQTWVDACVAVQELIVQPHDYKTFVLDTGNGAEYLGHVKVCEEKYGGDWGEHGFGQFARGEKECANKHWSPFLADLDRLRERVGMRIVLLCHDGTKNTKNPDGPDYDKLQPGMSKPAWAMTAKWADMILHGAFQVQVQKDDPKNKLQKAKGKGGSVRVLHTSPRASYEAKNCHGLPAEIILGDDHSRAFARFVAAFPKQQPKQTPAAPAQPQTETPAPADEPPPQPPETPDGEREQGDPDRPTDS